MSALGDAALRAAITAREAGTWEAALEAEGIDPNDAFIAARTAPPNDPEQVFYVALLTGVFYERSIREAVEELTSDEP